MPEILDYSRGECHWQTLYFIIYMATITVIKSIIVEALGADVKKLYVSVIYESS